jgi:hypothetical protein
VPSPAADVDPERFDIGRPKANQSEYEPLPEDTDPADLPTMGSLWCIRKVMTFLIVFFAL